jgi:hypothetical protein
VLRLLVLALLWTVATSATAQGVTRHPAMPHLFARGLQPQVAFFVPGNAGDAVLRDPPGPAGHVPQQGELRCDGLVLEVYTPDYHWPPAAGDGYWQRLEVMLASAARAGMIVDLRITAAGAALLASAGRERVHAFAGHLAEVTHRNPCVIISFDFPAPDPAAVQVSAAIRAACPSLLTGQRLPADGTLKPDADFAVVSPASAPPGYRDQAAVGYWHHRLRGRPVVFELSRPDPNASLFWFACGVAGLQHTSLPPPSDPANRRGFLALRATSALLQNLPDGRCPPRPELAGAGIAFAMGTENDFMGYLVRPAASPHVSVSSSSQRPDVVSFWFSIPRNQTIIEPRVPGPVSRRRMLAQPSNDGWFWGYYALPASDDHASTVTEGRDIPDGPFM